MTSGSGDLLDVVPAPLAGATTMLLHVRRWGDSDARLFFLVSCSDLSACSIVGLGAKMLELAPLLGV